MKYINQFNKFKLNEEELDFKMSTTDYEIVKINPLFIPGTKDEIYRFITTNNNSYDLYFSLTNESDYTLSNGNNIKNITKSFIPTIFFHLAKEV